MSAVTALLGDAQGKFIPVPPLVMGGSNTKALALDGEANPPLNSLEFIDRSIKNHPQEISIGESTIVMAGAQTMSMAAAASPIQDVGAPATTAPSSAPAGSFAAAMQDIQNHPAMGGPGGFGGPGGAAGPAGMLQPPWMQQPGGVGAPGAFGGGVSPAAGPSTPSMTASNTTTAYLPVWAYNVRTLYLALNQIQLIYRLNEHYSIGVTLTKQGNNYSVTDIAVCSFEPLMVFPVPPSAKNPHVLNFAFSKDKMKSFPPVTLKGLKIGASYADVLNKYGWPKYSYPFVAKQVGVVYAGTPTTIPVPYFTFTRNNGQDSISPQPSMYESTGVAGANEVSFTDGTTEMMDTGFVANCFFVYPEAGLAITVVNMKVVRLQIGNGVTTPPTLGKSSTTLSPDAPSAPFSTPPSTQPAGTSDDTWF
jgi:hypothetical protein